MHNIDGLLNGNVSPVRNLNDSLQSGDGQEGIVVLKVNGDFGVGEFWNRKREVLRNLINEN